MRAANARASMLRAGAAATKKLRARVLRLLRKCLFSLATATAAPMRLFAPANIVRWPSDAAAAAAAAAAAITAAAAVGVEAAV